MKTISIFHNTLNVQGGAERFTVDLIAVLKNHGYEVHLATFDKVDWKRVEANMGLVVKPDKCISVFWKRLPIFGIYQRLFMGLIVSRMGKDANLTINTHSDHLFCHCDVVYMHGLTPFSKLHLPWWKIPYVAPYRLITWFAEKNSKQTNSIFIANSKYTARQLLKHGINCEYVIHPPVHTEIYSPLATNSDRENMVLTISRYANEKNLSNVIEIAKRTKGVHFDVVGTVVNRFNEAIADKLTEQANRLNLPIAFHRNITQQEKRALMGKAKVYLQPGIDTFGLALCESVSAGCLPVVLTDSCLEALDPLDESTGYVYGSFNEAATQIEKAVATWTPELAECVSSRMEKFNVKRFDEEIVNMLTELNMV